MWKKSDDWSDVTNVIHGPAGGPLDDKGDEPDRQDIHMHACPQAVFHSLGAHALLGEIKFIWSN